MFVALKEKNIDFINFIVQLTHHKITMKESTRQVKNVLKYSNTKQTKP